MSKRKHITIRPRVGSALERVYDNRRGEIAGLAHKWAEMEEQGWSEMFAKLAKENGDERDG